MVLKIAAGAMAAAMLLGGAGLAAHGGSSHGSSSVRLAAAVSKPKDPKCPTGTTTVTVDGYETAQAAPNEITISLGVQTQSTKANVAIKNTAKSFRFS